MATGLAKSVPPGKFAAFGARGHIVWSQWSHQIFRNNPRIARPDINVDREKLVWFEHYKGHRLYNKYAEGRWVWNYEFKAIPGEFYFDKDELEYAETIGHDFIFIEPNVPWHKVVAPNKDWGLKKYQAVADRLLKDGHDVVQTSYGRDRLDGVRTIEPGTFRRTVAVMTKARMAILPEGGLHHAAAAVDKFAVVLFGGFIPPAVTGYDMHVSLTGGAEACGTLRYCPHCKIAMQRISVEEVYAAAMNHLAIESMQV